MKVISKKALIHITTEEDNAIGVVAALLDTIHKELGDEAGVDLYGMLNGDELCDTFFDNEFFDCEVDIDLKKGEE